MTNNPTIDGVSRELLETIKFWLERAQESTYDSEIDGLAELRAVLDAPAVERQDPEFPTGAIHNGQAFIDQLESIYAFKEQQGHPLSLCSEWQELVRCFEWLAMYATDVQSTIARLEARITQLESEATFAAATYQAARDRIAELEIGRGEPVGYGTFKNGRYGSWLFRTEPSAKVHLRTANNGYPMEAEIHALYTAPPAPVATLWEIRIPDEPQNPESPAEYFYAQNAANRDLLLMREGATVVAEYACLDATAALNGVKS